MKVNRRFVDANGKAIAILSEWLIGKSALQIIKSYRQLRFRMTDRKCL